MSTPAKRVVFNKRFSPTALMRAARLLEDYGLTEVFGRRPEDLVESFFKFVNSRDQGDMLALQRLIGEGSFPCWKVQPHFAQEHSLRTSELIQDAQKKLQWIAAASEEERLRELAAHGGTQASGVVCITRRAACRIPQLRIIDGREEYVDGPETIQTFHLWFFTSPESAFRVAIDYILEMITRDRRDPLGRKILCQCQLPNCGAWFFAYRNEGADAKIGLPQRSYCTVEHAQAGNRIKKREWTRARRQEASVQNKTTKAKRPK